MRIYKINLLTFFVIQSRLKTIDLTKVINKINKTRLCIKNSYISRKKNGVDKKAIAQQRFCKIWALGLWKIGLVLGAIS